MPPDKPTFLFTDVVGSTRRWQDHADTMGHDLSLHDAVLRAAAADHGGHVFSTAGDSFGIAFPTPDAAIDAAIDGQRGLRDAPLIGPPINVRMGAHTGYAESRDGDYFGHAVNVAARVMGLADARQFVITEAAYAAARFDAHPEVQVRPIGEHRLKSVTEPHQLYQVIGDGLSHVVIVAPPPAIGNAPLARTGYVGRERDVSTIVDAVLDGRRVITLTGIGGAGKTRTAMEIAAIVGGRFEDGVWWCDLTAAADDAAVAGVVASSLGASSLGAAAAAQAVVARLRSATALLVLDNCEHVVTGARQIVDAIVVGCPGTTVIATSRESLRLQGETAVPMRPLDAETEGVALLVERASAEYAVGARPKWDPEVLAEICRQLDGIPLALEMAGVRLRSLDAPELLARLDDRLRLLNAGGAAAGARHETLGAMLDWSVELLDLAELELFRSLGVFAGSFDLAAVCAVAAPGGDDIEVLGALGGLVDKSLVVTEWHAESGTRYRLLETIRQYAFDGVAAETVATLRERHAAHYAAVADALDQRYVAAANFDSYRSQWELEFDNVMGSAEHAVADADVALLDRLLGAAYSYACPITTRYRMADVALSALAAGVAAPAAYAVASFFSHDPAEKLELAETGLAITDAADGDAVRSEYFLLSQVVYARSTLRPKEAREPLQRTVALSERRGPVDRAFWFASIAMVMLRSDAARAVELADQAERLVAGPLDGFRSMAAPMLAMVEALRGDADGAMERLRAISATASHAGVAMASESADSMLAQIAAYTGRPDAAKLLASSLESQRGSTRWSDEWPVLAAAASWLGTQGDAAGMATITSFMVARGLDRGALSVLDVGGRDRTMVTDDPVGRAMTTDEVVDFALERLAGD